MNIDIEINEQDLIDALEGEIQNAVDNVLDSAGILQRDDVEYIVEDMIEENVNDAVFDLKHEIDEKVSRLQGKIESLERLVKQIQSQSMRAVRLAKN